MVLFIEKSQAVAKRRKKCCDKWWSDKIYGFLFNLPCLLQRLVDDTILFSLFLQSGNNWCDALGRWFFFHSRWLIQLESLDWGAFFLSVIERAAKLAKDKSHLIRRSTNYWAPWHFLQLQASFFELENSIFASGNYFITNIFHHFTQLSWKHEARLRSGEEDMNRKRSFLETFWWRKGLERYYMQLQMSHANFFPFGGV